MNQLFISKAGRGIVSLACCCLLFSMPLLITFTASAGTGQIATQGAGGESTNGWTTPANARGTADNDTYATANPGANQKVSGIWTGYDFNTALPLHAVITKVEVIPQYRISNMLTDVRLEAHARVNNTDCPVTPLVDNSRPTSDTEFVADVTSCRSWVRADLLDASFATKITAHCNGLVTCASNFSLDYIKTTVTYTIPDYNQVAYRWFDNTDSTGVGSTLAGLNAVPTLYAPRDHVRLRILVKVSLVPLLTSSEQFKLQFGQKVSTCDAASYSDVTASSVIAFYNNPTPTSNTALTTNGSDPTHTGTTSVAQSYSEVSPIVTLTNVPVSDGGLWDLSLVGNGALADTTYCLRLVKNSGTPLTTYTVYPEVITSPSGSLLVDFVDSAGNPLATPAFNFESMISPVVCIANTATLGVSDQKLRIKNTTDTAGWSVSIAATNGSTALWSAGTPQYDFNDGTGSPAGCSAGLESDTYAGQMTINPVTATVTPRGVSNCTTTGISKGSSAAFSEGSLNAISLLTASGSVKTGCFWDVTGISVSQQVPGGQPPGNYSLNLTVTVLAS